MGIVGQHSPGMNADVLAAVGDIFAAVGIVIATIGLVMTARSGRAAAQDNRQAAELTRQTIEQARLSVAEARAARREERLYRELERLGRLIELTKRMWAVVNGLSLPGDSASSGHWPATREMDAVLYEFRAALAVFDRDELPRCRHLADSHNGPALIGNGGQIQEAETEVEDAISRRRQELRDRA